MIQLRMSLLFAIAVFSSYSEQAPATSAKQYEDGISYQYKYNAAVLFNEPPPLSAANSSRTKGTDVGYQISSAVEVSTVWLDPSDANHILLEVLMTDPKLSIRSRKAPTADGFADHASPLDDLANTLPVYLDWNSGKINNIYVSESESPSLVNLKKGIASLFQLQSATVNLNELDASGTCDASYKTVKGRTFLKKKTNCQYSRSTSSSSFSRPQKILGVSISSEHKTKYNLKEDIHVLETLTTTEEHSLRVNLRTQVGASVISRQTIHLNGEMKTKKKFSVSTLKKAMESAQQKHGVKFVQDNLQVVEEPIVCTNGSCKSLADSVNTLRKDLVAFQLASSTSAAAFVTLLPIFRRASKTEILLVLKDNKNKQILPQLLDLAAAAQTDNSHSSAVEILNFKSDAGLDLAERYLMAVSLATHPSEFLLQDLLRLSKTFKIEKLFETSLMSLAAVTKAFTLNEGNSKPIVEEVRNYFLTNLEACKEDVCRQLYMRVLKNLASLETLPVILSHINSKDKKTSVAAVKALKALPATVFQHPKVRNTLQRVYLQIGRRYDSSARTLALDALLEHQLSCQSETEFLREVLVYVSKAGAKESELTTYTLQRLQEFAGNNPAIRSQVKQILSEGQMLNNYDVFSQNGLSTAFTRFMYRDATGNGTFSSSTEAVSGTMKRSSFDIYLNNLDDSFHMLSFGLFTGGLGSFMGGGGDSEDDEEATAGMEITLSNVQLRPFIFFTGQGELMSHVWAGTASERTSALQGTVLLQDHRQVFPLQSGFSPVLSLLGSVSFDFGGEIQISIWNRNSHSVVDNRASWKLDGALDLATPFIKSSVDFTVGAQAKIDFVTDVNFGDGLLACLRMGQSQFNIDYTLQKRESIPGSRHWVHKKKKRIDVSPGRSYALNDKNSAFCNQMFSQNNY